MGSVGLCVLWSSIFPSGMGAGEASPAALTVLVTQACICAVLWQEHSCFCSSLWKRLGAVGLNGDPGRAVVLSYQRAAIFGFQILIVKQIPFDSSAAGQNSIMC